MDVQAGKGSFESVAGKNIEECGAKLLAHEVDAVVMDQPTMAYYHLQNSLPEDIVISSPISQPV